jgi:PAS domain S-box-containing protein
MNESSPTVSLQIRNPFGNNITGALFGSGIQDRDRVYRAIFDSMFQFMGVLTPGGQVVDVNRSALNFAAIDRGAVLGHFAWETPWFAHDSSARLRLREAIKRAANGDFLRYEEEIIGASSARAPIDLSIKPVRDASSRVILLIAEGRDITESRVAREALRDSQQRFQMLFDHTSIGLATIEPDGHWMQVNRALTSILGCDDHALVSLTLRTAVHPDDRMKLDCHIDECLHGTRDSFQMKTELRAPHTVSVPVHMELSLLRDELGAPAYFVAQIERAIG